jgi:D-alanine-D-alanine ligase
MKIGLTYDLREDYLRMGFSEEETAEFDRPDTVEAIERTLKGLGHDTDRIGNVRHLVQRLAGGDQWDLVFNIAEGLRGYGREAQVPALLEAYDIPYTFSDPLVLSLTLHKGLAKRVVRDLGIATPDFCVVENEEDLGRVDLPFPLFVKPVAEGTGKGITPASRTQDRNELAAACRKILGDYRQPALVERFLPGREFTVGIAGTGHEAEVLGVMEVILLAGADDEVYSYRNKENCEELVRYILPKDPAAEAARAQALAVWRGLGCRDAGRVDLRADDAGVPNFMEVNPLAGLHPEHSDLPILCTLAGTDYRELLSKILRSASSRIGCSRPIRTR